MSIPHDNPIVQLRWPQRIGVSLGVISTAVSFTFDHLDSLDDGTVTTVLRGIAMCLIFPGLLCSAISTNMHDPNVIVAALCNLIFYSLLGVIATAIVRVYRNNTSQKSDKEHRNV